MKGGGHMRIAASFLIISFALMMFAGAAMAKTKTMSGEVIAVDAAKGTLTLKSGKVDVPFDCESGSMIKDVKVGDKVTVHYKMEGGKKVATKIGPMEMKKKSGKAK
jgi:lipopolysaccharide export system protein LptA